MSGGRPQSAHATLAGIWNDARNCCSGDLDLALEHFATQITTSRMPGKLDFRSITRVCWKVTGIRSLRSCRSRREVRKELWGCVGLPELFDHGNAFLGTLIEYRSYSASVHITAIFIESSQGQFILIGIVCCPRDIVTAQCQDFP